MNDMKITPAPESKAETVARLASYEAASIEQREQAKAQAFSEALAGIVRNAEPFASEAEIVKAVSDPRYSTDAEYRNAVLSRMAAQPSAPSQLDRMSAAVAQEMQAPADNGGFRSRVQMVKAMNSPAYQSDAAFRAETQRKLALTDMSSLR